MHLYLSLELQKKKKYSIILSLIEVYGEALPVVLCMSYCFFKIWTRIKEQCFFKGKIAPFPCNKRLIYTICYSFVFVILELKLNQSDQMLTHGIPSLQLRPIFIHLV